MTEPNAAAETAQKPPQWQPLSAVERRVAGVSVEKAKTTPEQYPLTINGLVAGCNQKSNRDPQTNLTAEDVEEALDKLRAKGAVLEVQGSGRVLKYRHLMYEWLGVSKVELGVMAELLLRGAQTEGELRGRAARMDPIPDLTALRPIVDGLKAKRLIISLTPEGRGHILTHGLYEPRELEALRSAQQGSSAPPPPRPASAAHVGPSAAAPPAVSPPPSNQLSRDFDQLRSEVSQLRRDLEELSERFSRSEDDLRQMKDSLGG